MQKMLIASSIVLFAVLFLIAQGISNAGPSREGRRAYIPLISQDKPIDYPYPAPPTPTHFPTGYPPPGSTNTPRPAPILYPIDNADGDDDFAVYWSTYVGADEYILREAINDLPPNDTLVYRGPNTTFSRSNMPPGEYCYRVRWIIIGGTWSGWSEVRCTTVHSPSPTPSLTPTITPTPTATPGLPPPILYDIINYDNENEFEVGWAPLLSADWYRLQENRNKTFWNTIYEGAATGVQRSHLINGQYCYRVSGFNKKTYSNFSAEKCTIVGDDIPLTQRNYLPVTIKSD